jgi:hypothetical protein
MNKLYSGKNSLRGIVTGLLLVMLVANADAVGYAGEYAVENIPANLKKQADAIVRLEESNFEIISSRETVHQYHTVITILNESGDRWADFYQPYDKLGEVVSVQGTLYDAAGNVIRKTRPKDIEDLSAVDEVSLFDDNRVKKHNFFYRTYPYTVEYSVTMRYRHTFYFPDWIPQRGERLAVEKSIATVICPQDYQFRYKAYNYPGEPIIANVGKKKSWTWVAMALPAITREVYLPSWLEITTAVLFGPTGFQLGNYSGSMATWKEMGQFFNELKQGRDVLPSSIRSTVHSLVDTIKDTRKKVEALYSYMQKNTRYISIQLGIGGWQPFDANFVATRSYGDCKALTNYMYSLLKEAGIRSAYTLVRGGQNDSRELPVDFPCNRFNHVILCVPLATDSIWLECTSQTLPAGYLGGFTANRSALLIDDNGGTLVQTPRYGVNENTQTRKVLATLTEDGNLHVTAHSCYRAMQQDYLHSLINNIAADRIKEYLHDQFELGTYEINKYDYKQEKDDLPCIEETLDLAINNYATVTGRRIFISPNLLTRTSIRLSMDTSRKYAFENRVAYRDVDTVEIKLPTGYTAESIPSPVTAKTQFGSFACRVELKENTLYYYRSTERYTGLFQASEYADLVGFFETIFKADRSKVVLVKN